jgi:Protein of unknown function (DUF1552)
MTIFKKAIPRRTMLRGIGAALALPLLDSMVPAFADPLHPALKTPTRLSFVYVPNGIVMEKWTPVKEGSDFDLTPTLAPLAPYKDQLLVLTGLCHNAARTLPGEGGGNHARGSGAYLTGVHPKKTEGLDIHAGISVDQIAAKDIGKDTQLASLELDLDYELVGDSDAGYSCAYTNTLSWRSATTPMPMENRPRAVFERLFGNNDSTDPKERIARIRKNRSILDSVLHDVSLSGLGPSDRSKLAEYLDSVRDVERRIQLAEAQSSRELPVMDRPVGVPATFEEHAKLMFDLQVLALQSDLTRVITFSLAREKSIRAYPEIEVPDQHHPISHHGGDVQKLAKLAKINLFHAKIFSYYLEKLRGVREGDGTLLDHMLVSYGSVMSDGNTHSNENLPALLAGGGGGKIKGGRHLKFPPQKELPNLFLTMLDTVGVRVDHLGDAGGTLELLAVA